MLKQNKLPTGLLLQNAGLISTQQLQDALELQAQYTEMKLGEINSHSVKFASSIIEYNPQVPIEKVVPTFTQTDAKVQPNSVPKQTATTTASLTRINSLVPLAAIALLIPLFLIINNYLASFKAAKIAANSARKINELQEFCNGLNADSKSLLKLIAKLETNQQQLLGDFPASCDTALNQLRVIAAPQLSKENKILEAIRHLCKVPANSKMYIDAEVWLRRWYDSASWGKETKFYLEEIEKHQHKSCPAAHFTEYKD